MKFLAFFERLSKVPPVCWYTSAILGICMDIRHTVADIRLEWQKYMREMAELCSMKY